MAFCYLASFDFADRRHNFGSVTFTRSGGGSFSLDLLLDVANGLTSDGKSIRVVNHYPTALTSAVGLDAEASTGLQYTAANQSFGALFQQRMRSAATSAGWPSPTTLTCSFSTSTLRYTFGYSGGSFTAITFSTQTTTALFGFAGSFSGNSPSVSGTSVPWFAIEPTLDAVTTEGQDGFDYEPRGISLQSVAEFGGVFGFTRPVVPVYRDWVQQSERRSYSIRASTQGFVWTHQDLFETCRCIHPFVVVDGFGDGIDYVFRLRPDSCMFSDKVVRRAGGDMDDTAFDISYSTQVLGYFA